MGVEIGHSPRGYLLKGMDSAPCRSHHLSIAPLQQGEGRLTGLSCSVLECGRLDLVRVLCG